MKRPLALAIAALTTVAIAIPIGTGTAHAAPGSGMFFSTVTFNSADTFATRGPITFTRTSTGRYTFLAAGIIGKGNVQLSMWDVDGQLPICTVSSVTRLSGSTRVKVRCNSSTTGYASDAVFSLFYNSIHTVDPTIHHVELVTGSSFSHTPSNQFRASGVGRATVRRLSTGRYRVRIPNETFPSNLGVVMTSATGTNPRWCNPSEWAANGSSTDVFVECHRRGGTLADSTFSFMITDNTMLGRPEVPGGSAWSNEFGRGAAHSSVNASGHYTFNSASNTNTHANQGLVGSAEVNFPGVFPPDFAVVAKLVVAYGPHRCAHQGLHGLFGTDVTLAVACRTANNMPIDASFDVMLELLIGE